MKTRITRVSPTSLSPELDLISPRDGPSTTTLLSLLLILCISSSYRPTIRYDRYEPR